MENIKTSNTTIIGRAPKKTRQSDRLDTPNIFCEDKQSHTGESDDCLPWEVKGAIFPHGTELRGRYKGYIYYGKVDNGAFVLHGKPFLSPSAAANTITRNTVDGWLFWDCQLPGESNWRRIYTFKNI